MDEPADALRLNPHWSPGRTGLLTIISRAEHCLKDKQAFGLIRLGDGEGVILAQDRFRMTNDLQACLNIWFGNQEFSPGELNEFCLLLKQAIKESDVIGVPRMAQINSHPRYAAVMEALAQATGEHPVLWTDAAVHFYLQWSGALGKLIRMASRVWVIGCRDVAKDLQLITRSSVGQWLVRGEAQYPGPVQEPHWRTGYAHTMEKIRLHTQPGDLILVGAGILGKAYVAAARAKGGVALDIGSVMDGWAGITSRGERIRDSYEFKIAHLENTFTDHELITKLLKLISATNIQDACVLGDVD